MKGIHIKFMSLREPTVVQLDFNGVAETSFEIL